VSSNLIKARTLESLGHSSIVKRDVLIACGQADEIVAQARDEAQRLVSEARRNAQEILESAQEQGYRSGAAEWYEALADAWKSRDRYVAANETAVLKLGVRIAKKLIGEELRTTPDCVVGIVKEAVRSARRAKKLVIQVHPADAAVLEERLPALRASTNAAREIEVIRDPSLAQGDCIVETDIGIIDARLETQLNNVERALTLEAAT